MLDWLGVRALLDAVADLAELGRLFEHARAHSAARERERRRHAAVATADDEDFRTSRAHGSGILHPERRLAARRPRYNGFHELRARVVFVCLEGFELQEPRRLPGRADERRPQ